MTRSNASQPHRNGRQQSRFFERIPNLFRRNRSRSQGNAVSPVAPTPPVPGPCVQAPISRTMSYPRHHLVHEIHRGHEKVELVIVDKGLTAENVSDFLDYDSNLNLRAIFFFHFDSYDPTLESDLTTVPSIVHVQADELLTLGGSTIVPNLWGGKWLVCCDGPGNGYIYFALIVLLMQVAKYDVARSIRELIMLEKGRLSQIEEFRQRDLSKPLHELYRDSEEFSNAQFEKPVKLRAIVLAEARLVRSKRERGENTRLDLYRTQSRADGKKVNELKATKDEEKLWREIVDCVERDEEPWNDFWSTMKTLEDWDKKFARRFEES